MPRWLQAARREPWWPPRSRNSTVKLTTSPALIGPRALVARGPFVVDPLLNVRVSTPAFVRPALHETVPEDRGHPARTRGGRDARGPKFLVSSPPNFVRPALHETLPRGPRASCPHERAGGTPAVRSFCLVPHRPLAEPPCMKLYQRTAGVSPARGAGGTPAVRRFLVRQQALITGQSIDSR